MYDVINIKSSPLNINIQKLQSKYSVKVSGASFTANTELYKLIVLYVVQNLHIT